MGIDRGVLPCCYTPLLSSNAFQMKERKQRHLYAQCPLVKAHTRGLPR